MPYYLLVISVILTVAAQLSLARGATIFKDIDFSRTGLTAIIIKFFQNAYLVAGLILFAMAFLFWVMVISKIKMSIAYPVAVALNLSLVVLGSVVFLKESMALWQTVGIFLLIIGIILVLWK